MKKNIFQSFINAFADNISEENKVVDCTNRYNGNTDISSIREIKISCISIDLRVYYSPHFYYKIYLSDEKQSNNLKFQLDSHKKQISFLIDFTKGDGKGYVDIYIPYVEKFEAMVEKSDLIIHSIESDVIYFENKSGDIVVNDMEVKSGILTEVSGDIVINCNRSDYRYDLKSKYGDVVCDMHYNLKSSKLIKCRNINGDIILNA